MIIRCPSCSTTYKVNGAAFDVPKPTFRCVRCKKIFAARVRLQLQEEVPAAGETPGAGVVSEEAVVIGEPEAGPEEHDQGGVEFDAGEALPPAAPPAPPQAEPELPPTPPPARAEPPVRASSGLETAGSGLDAPELPDPRFMQLEEADPGGAAPPGASTQIPAIEVEEVPVRNMRQPDFEIDDDFLLPKREVKPPPLPSSTSSKGSTITLVSVGVLVLMAFGLLALTHQINPQPLDSLLRQVPWLGSTLFESRHVKKTLVFESLVSGVRSVLNQKEVFVVSGKLVNRNDRSVHQVRIEAQLFDADGRQLGKQVTFVGNAISAKIIQDMTFREISLLQSLKPQNAYQIPANASADFTIVFPKPKTAVESFRCRVVSAEAPA